MECLSGCVETVAPAETKKKRLWLEEPKFKLPKLDLADLVFPDEWDDGEKTPEKAKPPEKSPQAPKKNAEASEKKEKSEKKKKVKRKLEEEPAETDPKCKWRKIVMFFEH